MFRIVEVLFWGTIVLAILVGLYFLRSAIKKARTPISSAKARIISKHTKVIGSLTSTSTIYFVTFEVFDGLNPKTPTMNVPMHLYGTLLENDAGTLEYKKVSYLDGGELVGRDFVSFTPDSD